MKWLQQNIGRSKAADDLPESSKRLRPAARAGARS